MWNFAMSIIGFAIALTIMVRLLNLQVRKEGKTNPMLLTVLFIVGTLAAWWFVTTGDKIEDRILSPIILPSPMEVLSAFPVLHFKQGLMISVVASFKRVATGFILAAILAIPLGTYMASFPPVAAFFKPMALVGSYVPIISFIPLTLAWWGSEEIQKIGFLFIACFVVLLPLVIKSINNVNASFLDVARTKGATNWQLVKTVLLPVAMPDIWGHLRGIYGVGWGWIIMAEVVNAQKGVGYLMAISERRGQTASLFALIIVIVVVAVLCDKAWKLTGDWLFPYRKVD